jgi:hypothetical protein
MVASLIAWLIDWLIGWLGGLIGRLVGWWLVGLFLLQTCVGHGVPQANQGLSLSLACPQRKG